MNRKIRVSFVCGFLSCLCVMMEAKLPLADALSDISILRSFKGSGQKKKLQQQSEFERLVAVLEEQSPDLQKSFIENAGKILLGVKLKSADKKALQIFLKTVAADADLNPADKTAINQFFKRGLSTGAKIGIGVGSAAAMTALIAMAVVAAKSGISRGMSAALKAVGDAGTGSAVGSPVPCGVPGLVVPRPLVVPSPACQGKAGAAAAGAGMQKEAAASIGGAGAGSSAGVESGASLGVVGGGTGAGAGSGQTPVAGAGAGAGSSSHARSGDSRVMEVAKFYFGADTPLLEGIGTSVLAVPQGLVRVGHLKNIKGRADQDACLVDVLPDGALRICLCDGTGESPLDHVFATEYMEAPSAEDRQQAEVILSEKEADSAAYVKIGGAGAATFIVNKVRKLSITPSCDKFNEIARLMHQQTDPIKRALDRSAAGDVSAKREVFAARKNPLLGGSSAISSVVLSSDGRMVEWSNLGDSGAFFLTTDGKMMHGPSLHPNLEGFHYKNGTTRMGYDDLDRQCEDVESFTSRVPENARYLVVACDGLMDCMKGPRRRITAEDQGAYEQGLRTRKRSSINTDKLYSEEEIDAMWEYACGDPLDTGRPVWLKKEYDDCKEGSPPITVRMLIACLEQAKRFGHNPGQALARLARIKGSKDDITVVVVDLLSLREASLDAAGGASTAGAGGNGVVGQRIADSGVEGSESGPAVPAELGGSLDSARIGEAPAGADADGRRLWHLAYDAAGGAGSGIGAGAGVGAHTGAGAGDAVGGVMDCDKEIDVTKLFSPDNLRAACSLGQKIGLNGTCIRRYVIAGSGDVLGLHKNARLKAEIEHSYVEDDHKVRAYVGHLSDSKGFYLLKVRGEEIGWTDQAAFRIEILPSGKLRVVVADGSGCAALYGWSQQHVTPDCTCDSTRCLFAEGGSGVAKAAVATIVSGKSIREGSDALRTQWRLYDSIHENVVNFDHSDSSFNTAKADPVFAQLFGGQAMVSCLELDSTEKRVRCDTVGYTGAVLLRKDGNYEVIGKSEHENLGGSHRRNLVFGGTSSSDDCVVDSSERIIIEADQFIIVACDGFWDAFKEGSKDSNGKVLVNPLPVRQVYESIVAAIAEGENPGQALADLARSKGSKDDITVVVVDLSPLREGLVAGSGAAGGDAVRAEVASGDSRIGEAPAGADASVGAGVGDGSGSVAAGDGTGSDALVARGGAGAVAGAGSGNNESIESLGLPTTKEEFDRWYQTYIQIVDGRETIIGHPIFGQFMLFRHGNLSMAKTPIDQSNYEPIARVFKDRIMWLNSSVGRLVARRAELQEKGANATEGASTGDETGSPPASVGAGAESGYGSGDFRCSEDSNIRALLEELAVQIVLPENETDLLKWMQDYHAEQGIPGEKFFCYSVEIGDFALRQKTFLWQPEDTCPMVTLVPDIHREPWLWSLSGLRQLKNHVAKVFSASSVSTEASGAESGEVVSVGGGSEAGVGGLPLAGAGAGVVSGGAGSGAGSVAMDDVAGGRAGVGGADEIITLVRELGLPENTEELVRWMTEHPYHNPGATGYATDPELGVFLKQGTKLQFFHEGSRGGCPMLLVPNISAPTWKWQKDVLDFLKEIKDGHRTVMF